MDDGVFKYCGNDRLQSQKLEIIGMLAYGIIHDINNILAVITVICDRLRTDDKVKEPFAADIRDISGCVDKITTIIGQVQTFTKKQCRDKTYENVNRIIDEMAQMLRWVIGRKSTIRTELDPALKNIPINPNQFAQIIMNLIINARDAMPDGGTVVIQSENVLKNEVNGYPDFPGEHEAYIKITVADTGTGMDEQTMNHVFDPFFSGGNKGSGFGMTIVSQLVKDNDGRISIENGKVCGTVFTLLFPVVNYLSGVPDAVASENEGADNEKTVVVVDENSDTRDIIFEILTRKGYRVIPLKSCNAVSFNCQDAGFDVDLLITDVFMSTITGIQLSEKFRRNNERMKTLYISGYAIDFFRNSITFNEMTWFLQKPFRTKELLGMVNRLLR